VSKISPAKAQRRKESRKERSLEPGRLCAFAPLREKFLSCLCIVVVFAASVAAQTASITVDARKVENRISPLLYGQFLEFMFEASRVACTPN